MDEGVPKFGALNDLGLAHCGPESRIVPATVGERGLMVSSALSLPGNEMLLYGDDRTGTGACLRSPLSTTQWR